MKKLLQVEIVENDEGKTLYLTPEDEEAGRILSKFYLGWEEGTEAPVIDMSSVGQLGEGVEGATSLLMVSYK